MKKLIILFAASVVTLAATAQTQIAQVSKKEMKHEKRNERKEVRQELKKLEGNEPSYQAQQAFLGNGDFENAQNVKWRRDVHFDVVSFTQDGIDKTAYYDINGELVGTILPKTFNDLPGSAQTWINKHYAGYQRGRVMMYDDNEFNDSDMELYGVQFEDADNYFIELKKGAKDIVLQVSPEGEVFFFADMK